MKKRIILFSHACNGLGHLRRLTRIAHEIQNDFAVLIITGMRDGFWMIPKDTEILYFPSWNSLRKKKHKQINEKSWLNLELPDALIFRRELLDSAINAFKPDAILVDYLPYGLHDELKNIIYKSQALKYLVLRGIIDSSDNEMFFHQKSSEIALVYNRILIAADKKIINFEAEYPLSQQFLDKQTYVGYVAPKNVNRQYIRNKRLNFQDKIWIVCSCGGGKNAEDFIFECLKIANSNPDYEFDIVSGPLSKINWIDHPAPANNCHVYTELSNLGDFHGACDILISAGGYNSIIEGIVGGSKIIVYPNQTGSDDEQKNNATRLSKFYPITLLNSLLDLKEELKNFVSGNNAKRYTNTILDINGSINIRDILLNDLNK